MDWLKSHVRAWLGLTPPKPKPVVIQGVKELVVLRYTIGLPAVPTIDDLDHREANVTIDGTASTISIPKESTSFTFDTERDKLVAITLVDVDTSGNHSAPSEPLSFTSTDTVPPPQPGTLSISNVEQV